MVAPVVQTQDFRFTSNTSSGLWSWVTRVDVSGAGPTYTVRDIISPFGILRDSISIPATVITAMNDSIDQLVENFQPSILLTPASLTITVDEGRGVSGAASLTVTNNGVYGSLLNVSATDADTWVSITPSALGNLPSNGSGILSIRADSTNLLASSSPYASTITVADPLATNTPRTASLSVVVRPKALIAVTSNTLLFDVIRPLSGPFPPISTQTFTVRNDGAAGSILDFQVDRLTGLSGNWLESFTPILGTLASGGTQAITVTLDPVAGMCYGVYEETLRVSGYSSNSHVDVLIRLTVT
jgi:hypothetical protein